MGVTVVPVDPVLDLPLERCFQAEEMEFRGIALGTLSVPFQVFGRLRYLCYRFSRRDLRITGTGDFPSACFNKEFWN